MIIIVLVQYFSFLSGRKQVRSMLPGHGLVIETSSGPVEYQIQGSSDKTVLLLHGTPGSYRTFMANVLVENGFRVLSPSRPGFFRTPLSSGKSLDQQAQLYAALLDALSIDSVAVIGFSGGGPSALQFAIDHPDRCSHLVIIAGIADKMPPPESSLVQALMSSEFISWTMMSMMASQFEDEETAEIATDYVRAIVFPFSEVVDGRDNDHELFTNLPPFDFDKIESPTLIIHGTNDEIVPYSQAELMKNNIPNSTLMSEEEKDHFTVVFFEFDKYLKASGDFINSN